MTAPKVSSSSTAQSTPLSYSARGVRPGLMLRSTEPLFHSEAKHLAAMLVVPEHVEARARGREQHRVTGVRRVARLRYRLVHRSRAEDRNAGASDRRLDQGRVAADENERARRAGDRLLEGGKVLALALAARDENHFRAPVRKPGERGDGGADVGALRVVVPAHPARFTDRLDTVRQALELAQRIEQRRERQPELAAEGERCERVRGVVQTGELHLANREQHGLPLAQPGFA